MGKRLTGFDYSRPMFYMVTIKCRKGVHALCAKGRMLFLSLWEPCAAKPDNATLYKRCHEMGDVILGAKRLSRSKTLKPGGGFARGAENGMAGDGLSRGEENGMAGDGLSRGEENGMAGDGLFGGTESGTVPKSIAPKENEAGE